MFVDVLSADEEWSYSKRMLSSAANRPRRRGDVHCAGRRKGFLDENMKNLVIWKVFADMPIIRSLHVSHNTKGRGRLLTWQARSSQDHKRFYLR